MLCPRCGKGSLIVSLTGMTCPVCGYDLYADDDHIPGNEPDWNPAEFNARQAAQAPATHPEPVIKPLPKRPPDPATDVIPIDLPPTIFRHDVPGLEGRELTRFEHRCMDASGALADGQPRRAREILRETLNITTNSDQVWLFLAGLALTREEQRAALEQALACNMNNLIALEALARLRGDLDEAAVLRQRLDPDQAAQVQVKCPNCGGELTFDVGAQQVTCHHCGQPILDVSALGRGQGPGSLVLGLLRRKNAPQVWNIGQRWLRCTSCGAMTTVSRLTLSSTCRFCGSQHVTVESTEHRFEQPDDIVPFEIDQEAAQSAIQHHLTSGLRRITRLFADDVARIDLQGVYLPMWVFDAEMAVNWSWSNAVERGEHPILLGDVLWCATSTLPRRLFHRVEPFDLLRGKAYDPRLLAVFPAELYHDDIARASLDVRPRLRMLAEERAYPTLVANRPVGHSNQFGSNESAGRLLLSTTTRYMSYRFALVPVWIGRLVETDGDTQPVLVNGQTGKVALARVEKNGNGE